MPKPPYQLAILEDITASVNELLTFTAKHIDDFEYSITARRQIITAKIALLRRHLMPGIPDLPLQPENNNIQTTNNTHRHANYNATIRNHSANIALDR